MQFRNSVSCERNFQLPSLDPSELGLESFVSTVAIKYARWAPWKNLITLQANGWVVVRSMDGETQLSLAPHKMDFRVSFPLNVNRKLREVGSSPAGVFSLGGSGAPLRYEYTYVRMEQVFPVCGCPSWWRYPLKLARPLPGTCTPFFEELPFLLFVEPPGFAAAARSALAGDGGLT